MNFEILKKAGLPYAEDFNSVVSSSHTSVEQAIFTNRFLANLNRLPKQALNRNTAVSDIQKIGRLLKKQKIHDLKGSCGISFIVNIYENIQQYFEVPDKDAEYVFSILFDTMKGA